jgi:hypothetical protein
MTNPKKDEESSLKWISVKDKLPEVRKNVLCYFPNKEYGGKIAIDYMETLKGYFARQFKYGKVTHWCPLPETPEGNN